MEQATIDPKFKQRSRKFSTATVANATKPSQAFQPPKFDKKNNIALVFKDPEVEQEFQKWFSTIMSSNRRKDLQWLIVFEIGWAAQLVLFEGAQGIASRYMWHFLLIPILICFACFRMQRFSNHHEHLIILCLACFFATNLLISPVSYFGEGTDENDDECEDVLEVDLSFPTYCISMLFLYLFRCTLNMFTVCAFTLLLIWVIVIVVKEEYASLLLCGWALWLSLFLIYGAYYMERGYRKEFKTARCSNMRVQVLQEEVAALQQDGPDDGKELDMTSKAQKALDNLATLMKSESLSPQEKESLVFIRQALVSSDSFSVDVKKQIAQGKGVNLHTETQAWLASQFKTGVKYNDKEAMSSQTLGSPTSSFAIEHQEAQRGSEMVLSVGKEQHSSMMQGPQLDPQIFDDSYNEWDVDVYELVDKISRADTLKIMTPFMWVVSSLFHKHDLVRHFNIAPVAITNFLRVVNDGYVEENPYHNLYHALDVTLSAHYILTNGGMGSIHSKIDMFAVIVAAACHDVEHIGYNNNFMINSHHKFALRYNDSSVMENHHAAFVFFTTKRPKIKQTAETTTDIFVGLDADQYKLIRKIIIDCILATDLGQHFNFMGRFTTTTSSAETFKTTSKKHRLLLLCAVLKMSDVGHTAKGKENHMKWTEKIMEEFFCQGEKEKELNMSVSAFMDREKMKNQKGICQEGFLNFIVLPLYKAWVGIFDDSSLLLSMLENNYQYWNELAEQERVAQQPTSPP